MTPPRRPRTGTRRDGLVRTLNTGEVRYPGFEHPALTEDAEYRQWRESGRVLRPARDTGIALEGRLTRERRHRERMRRRRTAAAMLAVVALGLAGLGWRYNSDRAVAEHPEPLTTAAAHASESDSNAFEMRALGRAADPTPFFASRGSLQLRLPVSVEDLTEVGFHQASYAYALHMKTPLEKADMKAAKKNRSTGRDVTKQETGPSATLTGQALVMWRDRPGKPDTAVDVGADPGSRVVAPVSGTVVKVKRYKLYGKYDDVEIHIRPNGFDDIDLVMIHIDDVTVEPGDTVVAGVTRLGMIRKLSDRERLQLGSYTRGGGDHTHMQLNDAKHPQYKGLKGALEVSGS